MTTLRPLSTLILASLVTAATASATDTVTARVERVLEQTPLIDGHNDLPWEIRTRFDGDVAKIDLAADTSKLPAPEGEAKLMTDIPRLRAGHVGGQFWSVWIPVSLKGPEAVQVTLEQMDIVKAMAARWPRDFAMAYTAADIRRIHKEGRIASLIGIEGGHQINNSLAVLREYYAAGARYMTLAHSSNTDWSDSATDAPAHHGLTPFGKEVVREMNRLGMLIDLSHVSDETMNATLDVSQAPVIFSHSSARALDDHPRDVSDEILRRVAKNGGVVMANFALDYVSDAYRRWDADRSAEQARYSSPPFGGLYIGNPERAKAALAEWEKAHPAPKVTLAEVADHIEHVAKIAGVDHVGIGSDFDGIPETPQGLDGVDKYPALLAELARRGWSDADLAKVAGNNVLRVMTQAEVVAAKLRTEHGPSMARIGQLDRTPAKAK